MHHLFNMYKSEKGLKKVLKTIFNRLRKYENVLKTVSKTVVKSLRKSENV